MNTENHTSQITFLSTLDLFRSCNRGQLHEIARLCDSLTLPAGTILFRQGSRARQCLIIVEGSAIAAIDGATIGSVVPRSLLGHRTVLCREPATATITAVSPIQVLVFSTRDFLTLAEGNPRLAPEFRRQLTSADPLIHAAVGRLSPAGV